MTKLLDNLELFYLGRRHAELGPLPVEIDSVKEINNNPGSFTRPPTQEEMRIEVRIGAVGTVPADWGGQVTPEYTAVSENLIHMIADEIYGEITRDLRALLVKVGELHASEIRERLSHIIGKMEP